MKDYFTLKKQVEKRNSQFFEDGISDYIFSEEQYFQLLKLSIFYDCYEIFNILLEENRFQPESYNNVLIRNSSTYGRLNFVKKLLTIQTISPEDNNNAAIREAYTGSYFEIAYLLFNCKNVKSTLMIDNPELYERINQDLVINKINAF
jgi:hypothetical protein